MLQVLWDTRGYFLWLLAVSLLCLLLERAFPWRRHQKMLRRQFAQDVFWLFFNGHYLGIMVAHVGAFVAAWALPVVDGAESVHLLTAYPLWLQFVVLFLLKDVMEWAVHNMLHRVSWLWAFHKLHHSIEEMDWIGNFRFHWMEIIVYRGLTYFPLVMLSVDGRVVLGIAVLSTLIGNLNHSNINITWGPLRYVLNSPRMHIWHHDKHWPAGRRSGVNFGITLSLWDWLFGTAYWPDPKDMPQQQPDRLGFEDMDRFPRGVLARLIYPLSRMSRTKPPAQRDSQSVE